MSHACGCDSGRLAPEAVGEPDCLGVREAPGPMEVHPPLGVTSQQMVGLLERAGSPEAVGEEVAAAILVLMAEAARVEERAPAKAALAL